MQGTVHQININPAGGVPKNAVEQTRIEFDHVAGDKQRHLEFHGGPMRAVCLYSLERIAELRAEGHPIAAGQAGENLTLTGLDWDQVTPGTRLSIGDAVVLEITQFTEPCRNIAYNFVDNQFKRMKHALFPGWARVYAKVLHTGLVRRGDVVTLLATPADVNAAG